MGWQLALVFKPLILLMMFAPGAVVKTYVQRMKECKVKRILLISWRV